MDTDDFLVEGDMEPLTVETGRDQLTERIIACAFKVSNALGVGFLEGVYEKALLHELRKVGLEAKRQEPLTVRYDDVVVGEFFADILVEDSVILELKAVKALDSSHFAQCLNYLKATNLHLALLINFGTPRIQLKRIAN